MRCTKCGQIIPDNASVCPSCQNPVKVEEDKKEIDLASLESPYHWSKQDTYALIGLGICAITGGILSPVALFFSIFSLKGKQKHRWLSFWGIGLSAGAIIIWIVILLLTLLAK